MNLAIDLAVEQELEVTRSSLSWFMSFSMCMRDCSFYSWSGTMALELVRVAWTRLWALAKSFSWIWMSCL